MHRTLMALLGIMAMGFFPVPGANALNIIVQTNNNNVTAGPLGLVSSKPFDRQVLSEPPESISLTFTQPILPHKSYIRLYNSFGQQIDVGELESEGMGISVALPALNPGKYKVKWKVRCRCDADTEINDRFSFTVR